MRKTIQSRLLVAIETHPVQYHAPVYRRVKQQFGVPVHVIYGSDFSVAGYHDKEFGAHFSWDSGVVRPDDACTFLQTVATGGATDFSKVKGAGLGRALSRLAPGAVLLTGYNHALYRRALSVVTRLRVPLLYRAETTDHAIARRPWKAALRDVALRALYKRCSALLPIGLRSREHYIRLGVREEALFWSPYCVDAGAFQPDEAHRLALRDQWRERAGLPRDAFVVLFSGKLSRRKGTHLLVEALAQIPGDLRRCTRLVFLGDGQERDALREQAHACGIHAHFLGFRNQSELSPVYHSADLLVLPSVESETWGLVVNEALLHGVPVVVSDAVGCAPDLVRSGETGFVVPTGSPSSIAAAVAAAAVHLRSEPTRVTCRRTVERYSVEQAARGIADALVALETAPGSRVPDEQRSGAHAAAR